MTHEEVLDNVWSTGEDSSSSSWLTGVMTYVIHLLGTYVTILCNWLILLQNVLYL